MGSLFFVGMGVGWNMQYLLFLIFKSSLNSIQVKFKRWAVKDSMILEVVC